MTDLTMLPACRGKVTPVDSTEVEAGTTLILRAWRTECDPTREQQEILGRYFECVRRVWNWGLRQCVWAKAQERKRPSAYDLSKQLTRVFEADEDIEWLREPPRQTIDYTFQDLDLAYKAAFRNLKAGVMPPGFPVFKVKNRCVEKCRFRGVRSCSPDGVLLPKIGFVRVKENDYLPWLSKEHISFASITKTAGKYWLSVTGETNRPNPIELGRGISVVSFDKDVFKITVNGVPVDVPGATQHEDRRIKLLQRRISRRRENSGGYFEARKLHQVWERRVADRRAQFLHNLSIQIVRENEEIVVMKPDFRAMLKDATKPDTESILSNAAGEFFRQLSYKSAWYGKTYSEISHV